MSDTETAVDTTSETSHLDDIFGVTDTEFSSDEETTMEQPDENLDGADIVEGEEVAEPQETNDEMSELRSQFEALKQQVESKDSQIKNAQSLIDRQGNELGQLRTSQEANPELTADEFLNEFADDPVKANQKLLQVELDRRESAKADQEHITVQNRSAVLNLVPDFDSKVDGIREWYKEKGASDEFVKNLSANSLMNNIDLAVALGEIQNLKGQLVETGNKTTNVINKLNKGSAVVSGKSGQPSSSDSTIQIPSDITELSDKQLEAMIKRSA